MEKNLGSRVYLRALDISDFERVFAWHNDASLYDKLGGNFRWISNLAEEEWIHRRCVYSTSEVNLAICISDTNEHIGNAYLRDIDWIARHSELHIFIGAKDQRGLGYGEETMDLVLTHAFRDLGLHRIFLFVLESNKSAQKLYKKCGFVEEGCLRQHAFKKGHFEDVFLMGLVNTEWKSNGNL